MRSRVKLSLIADESSRRITFKKRKNGIMKKLNELVTLCGVKACAVFDGPYSSDLESWPSREGVGEVFSKFMEFPTEERTKKMLDQEAYTWERIKKVQEQVKKMRDENREFEIREFMFDCLKGKVVEYNYGASDIRDLHFFIDYYINELTRRIEILTENGESTLLSGVDVADLTHVVVADADAVSVPVRLYDHIQLYENMNMGSQQELVQHQAPANFCDLLLSQNMNQQEPVQYQAPTNSYDHIESMNQQAPVQYQAPANFYDQNQQRFNEMNLDLNHNLRHGSNQHQSFMDLLVEQHSRQMGYVEEHVSIPCVDGNHQQLPTIDLATTTTTVDLFAPNINNNRWPTRFGL